MLTLTSGERKRVQVLSEGAESWDGDDVMAWIREQCRGKVIKWPIYLRFCSVDDPSKSFGMISVWREHVDGVSEAICKDSWDEPESEATNTNSGSALERFGMKLLENPQILQMLLMQGGQMLASGAVSNAAFKKMLEETVQQSVKEAVSELIEVEEVEEGEEDTTTHAEVQGQGQMQHIEPLAPTWGEVHEATEGEHERIRA